MTWLLFNIEPGEGVFYVVGSGGFLELTIDSASWVLTTLDLAEEITVNSEDCMKTQYTTWQDLIDDARTIYERSR